LSRIRSLYTFDCPCCNTQLNAIKILHPQVNNGCKSIKDKKCFYCPKCGNKIGNAHSAVLNATLQGILIFFVYFSTNFFSSYFEFPPYIVFLIYIILFYLLLILFVKIYPFACFREETKEIKRENFMTDFHPYQDVRIDDFEKNTIKTIYLVPVIIIIGITILILIALFAK